MLNKFKEVETNVNYDLLNILIGEKGWGNMGKEQAIEYHKGGMFYCGLCSKLEKVNIYHNLIGQHRHLDLLNNDFQNIIKNKIKELQNNK